MFWNISNTGPAKATLSIVQTLRKNRHGLRQFPWGSQSSKQSAEFRGCPVPCCTFCVCVSSLIILLITGWTALPHPGRPQVKQNSDNFKINSNLLLPDKALQGEQIWGIAWRKGKWVKVTEQTPEIDAVQPQRIKKCLRRKLEHKSKVESLER